LKETTMHTKYNKYQEKKKKQYTLNTINIRRTRIQGNCNTINIRRKRIKETYSFEITLSVPVKAYFKFGVLI